MGSNSTSYMEAVRFHVSFQDSFYSSTSTSTECPAEASICLHESFHVLVSTPSVQVSIFLHFLPRKLPHAFIYLRVSFHLRRSTSIYILEASTHFYLLSRNPLCTSVEASTRFHSKPSSVKGREAAVTSLQPTTTVLNTEYIARAALPRRDDARRCSAYAVKVRKICIADTALVVLRSKGQSDNYSAAKGYPRGTC